jgi:hypothetical protein
MPIILHFTSLPFSWIRGVDIGQNCPAKPINANFACLISLTGLGVKSLRSISPSLSWLASHAPRFRFPQPGCGSALRWRILPMVGVLACTCGRRETSAHFLLAEIHGLLIPVPPTSLSSSPPLHSPLPLRNHRRGKLHCRHGRGVPRTSSPFPHVDLHPGGATVLRAPLRQSPSSSFLQWGGVVVRGSASPSSSPTSSPPPAIFSSFCTPSYLPEVKSLFSPISLVNSSLFCSDLWVVCWYLLLWW